MITLNNEPDIWTPAYSPVEFTVTSTNYTNCNFEYTADIYINGDFITTLTKEPSPDNSAVFEFKSIIQNYLKYNLSVNVNWEVADSSYVEYYVRFGERYNTNGKCDGSTTLYSNLTTSDLKYAWNGGLPIEQFYWYNPETYVYNGSPIKFLTNQPATVSITEGDYAQLSYIQTLDLSSPPLEQFTDLQIKTYSVNRVLIDTFRIPNTQASLDNVMMVVGVGYANIAASTILTPDGSSTLPVFKPEVAYYTVNLINANNSDEIMSEVKTYKIDKTAKISPVRFYFQGRLGNMDSYTFTNITTLNDSISKTEFTRLNNSHSPTLRGRTIIDSESTEKYTSKSGWMTESEARWIRELFSSPEVYTMLRNTVYCFFNGEVDDLGNIYLYFANPEAEDLGILLGAQMLVVTDTGTAIMEVFEVDGNVVIFKGVFDGVPTCGTAMVVAARIAPELYFTPVIVTNNDFETKQKRTTKNINYTINYEMSNTKQIQRN